MSTMKALLVGAGGMGKGWGRNIREYDETDLVGWVDIRPGAAEEAIKEQGAEGTRAFNNLDEAIAATEPDFVVDVTIPEAHHDVTLTALAAGIPVLGEKPMAHTMEAARAMVAASEKAGKLYMVSQSRRYDGRIVAMRRLTDQLGPLGILNSDFYIGAHFGGFRDEMESPLILDMAIHTFDSARLISGADPVSVYCEEFNPSWSWYKGAASATAIFEMSNGLIYTYRGSWCAEGRQTPWECEWRAAGPKGTATWDGDRQIVADVVTGPGGFSSEMKPVTAEPIEMQMGIAGSLREFVDALRTGKTPQGECHDNIKSLAMVFGAMESSRKGIRVKI